jgi:hypothetical protein
MRNALLVCLFASLFGCMRAVSPVQNAEDSGVPKEVEEILDFGAKKITVRNGTISLEMEKFIVPFYGISMRISDKNTNRGSGGYIEIRKVKDGYVYSNEVYSTIEEALKNCLEDYLDEYWKVFVEEGKVQLLIETINSFIDDEFLTAPFNDKWG